MKDLEILIQTKELYEAQSNPVGGWWVRGKNPNNVDNDCLCIEGCLAEVLGIDFRMNPGCSFPTQKSYAEFRKTSVYKKLMKLSQYQGSLWAINEDGKRRVLNFLDKAIEDERKSISDNQDNQ